MPPGRKIDEDVQERRLTIFRALQDRPLFLADLVDRFPHIRRAVIKSDLQVLRGQGLVHTVAHRKNGKDVYIWIAGEMRKQKPKPKGDPLKSLWMGRAPVLPTNVSGIRKFEERHSGHAGIQRIERSFGVTEY